MKVLSRFQLQIVLLARSQPNILPIYFQQTKPSPLLQVVQILLKMKDLEIWKLRGVAMISHKPKFLLTLPTC
jgi:hypothetical protein